MGRYHEAIADYDSATGAHAQDSPQYVDLSTQRCETLLRMGDYERVITDAQECVRLWPDEPVLQYHVFSALTGLGDYDKAVAVFRQIISPGDEARSRFQDWCDEIRV